MANDEDPALFGRSVLNTGDRGGSHNLVIGSGHRFTMAAFGGLLAGELNTISNLGASVSGGHMVTDNNNNPIAPKPPFP